jgi:acyl-CoA synthetase (AMP-forming)/AMP-acid ligase II
MVYDSKPWLKSYDPEVAPEIEIPDISLKDYLLNTFADHPDRAAFHYLGMTMTFGELAERSGRFANALLDHGMRKGDVVAVNLPNTPEYLIAIVGTLRAGCVISGLAPLLMPDEMAYQLNDSGARVLITLDLLFDAKVVGIAESIASVELILVSGVMDSLPATTTYPAGKPLPGKEVVSFTETLRQYPADLPEIALAGDDTCFLQYTGGTTGPSKGAVLTHGNMVANVCQFESWMQVEKGKETFLCAFPMFHMAGLAVASSGMAWGITQVLIPDPRNTEHIIKEYERFQPSILVNVPSLFLMLMAEPGFAELEFSQLKNCLSGAAPFPADKIRELEGVVGEGKMIEVWGMTEASPLVTVNPALGRKKIGSVGLPLPNTRMRVVDLEDGETQVPLGEEGELIVNGPQIMTGYLNRPEETRNSLREHDGAVWLHTGDVGRMDEDGFFYVVDRSKDMLIVSGYKVFSTEVEDKLYQHPAIEMCAIIGVPNPDRPDSEIVKLVVQKSDDYGDTPNEEVQAEIHAFAREKLAPYKVPKIFEFVDAVPLTAVGKVNKKALR